MTPLILLPGMMCDERLFHPQIQALSNIADISVADIGHHNNMRQVAENVLASAPEQFALAGLSMGGIVAMEIVAQAPERVTKLALIDTNPVAELEEVKKARLPQIEQVKSGDLFGVMRDEMKPRYLFDGPHKAQILDLCMDMAMDLGPDVFLNQSAALMNRPDYQDVLRSISIPTLIMCGRHDRLCPVEKHEHMHGLIANSHLEIIEEAGHLPVLEQPDAANSVLAQWLTV